MESAAFGARRAACLACVPLFLLAPGIAPAQAPLQSSLGAEVTRPKDAAQAALKAGNAQRALDIADTGLKTFPHDATLRFVRGVALTSLERLPEAEQAFEGLTREFPELPEPYNNLAVVRAAQGRLDLAREALEGAIRAVPDYATAHENLGDIYARLAARSYETAQRLDPANKTVAPKLKLVSAVPVQPAPRPPARATGGNPR
jgi:tetratricopeptide (TPR) repeat protein